MNKKIILEFSEALPKDILRKIRLSGWLNLNEIPALAYLLVENGIIRMSPYSLPYPEEYYTEGSDYQPKHLDYLFAGEIFGEKINQQIENIKESQYIENVRDALKIYAM